MSDASLVGVLRWEDPPPPVTGSTPASRQRPWALVAAQLRERPGRWGLIDTRSLSPTLLHRILTGVAWWAPRGAFEGVSRTVDGAIHTWARYVGPPPEETP